MRVSKHHIFYGAFSNLTIVKYQRGFNVATFYSNITTTGIYKLHCAVKAAGDKLHPVACTIVNNQILIKVKVFKRENEVRIIIDSALKHFYTAAHILHLIENAQKGFIVFRRNNITI